MRRARPWLIPLLAAGGAVVCAAAYHRLGTLYLDHRINYGVGLRRINAVELVYFLWYGLFGGVTTLLLTVALGNTAWAKGIGRRWSRLLDRGPKVLVVCVGVQLVAMLAVQQLVYAGAPLSDDESTYRFIAQTLLKGRVINPSPGDLPFFDNQFIVLDDQGWWGKYPIGWPLLLALGEAIGMPGLVSPLVTCGATVATFMLARRTHGERIAVTSVLLLTVSPQWLFTGAAMFSQPASCLCMLIVAWALAGETVETKAMLAAGTAAGFGVLVRPLPGALFLGAGLLYLLWRRGWDRRDKLRAVAVAAGPVLIWAAVFLLVNEAQTGSFFVTGYQAWHGSVPTLGRTELPRDVVMASSVFSGFLRQQVWLLGWPVVGALVALLARGPRVGLLWALVVADYAYRLIAPKTVIGTTGPVYLHESVPLLCVLTAAGGHRLFVMVARRAPRTLPYLWAFWPAVMVSVLVLFLPVQLRNLSRVSRFNLPTRLAAEKAPVVVFANAMLPKAAYDSWAYYPPPPHPDLEEPVIFVRRLDPSTSIAFWRRRFPQRRAFVFGFIEGEPLFWEVKTPEDFRPDDSARVGY